MTEATLEHINLTVRDPLATAAVLDKIFGWKIRWQGESLYEGFTVHVGGEHSYLALYAHKDLKPNNVESYFHLQGLNHLGVVVDDLDATEIKVQEAGYTPKSHADYEPGKRFYFEDNDGLEIEVISYKE